MAFDCDASQAQLMNQPKSPLVLFPSLPLPDALDNLAAMTQCLCEIHQEHYGMHLMHRMIHDTLIHFAQRAQGQTPPKA